MPVEFDLSSTKPTFRVSAISSPKISEILHFVDGGSGP